MFDTIAIICMICEAYNSSGSKDRLFSDVKLSKDSRFDEDLASWWRANYSMTTDTRFHLKIWSWSCSCYTKWWASPGSNLVLSWYPSWRWRRQKNGHSNSVRMKLHCHVFRGIFMTDLNVERSDCANHLHSIMWIPGSPCSAELGSSMQPAIEEKYTDYPN